MRKNFGAKPILYPQPVFIIAAYDENGKPNAIVARNFRSIQNRGSTTQN